MRYMRPYRHIDSRPIQTTLLLGGMVFLLVACGWLVGGMSIAVSSLLVLIAFLAAIPKLPPHVLMKLQGGRPIEVWRSSELGNLVASFSLRAGLNSVPNLYWLPASNINAVAVGDRDGSAIGISDGALRNLQLREIAGVLAHEISHIAAGDAWFLMLGEVIRRLTGVIATCGLILIVYIELSAAHIELPFWLPVIFIAAPIILILLQLALSRSREFAADAGAIRLTGDPVAFVSALRKIDLMSKGLWEHVFAGSLPLKLPSFLQTHPSMDKRISSLAKQYSGRCQPQVLVRPELPRQAAPVWRTHFRRGRRFPALFPKMDL